jgi:hypothetical protein
MLTNLKLKLLKKKLEKNLKKRDMSQLHSRLETIGFIIDEKDITAIETLRKLSSSLGIEEDNCKVLTFQKFKKNTKLKDDHLHHKQISWRGTIDNVNALRFTKEPFDVLIGYYNGAQPYLDFLISESDARFKVGLAASDLRLFDLQIQVQKLNTISLKKELETYLHVLGKLK